jgi:hypothetical protein
MSDLQPGEHFIEKLTVDDLVVYVYGFFERRLADGKFAGHMSHKTGVKLEGRVLSRAQHDFVGVISKRAYDFAERQGWPNDEVGVLRVLAYVAPRRRGLLSRLFGG